jgi:hypothetical protein
MANLLRPESRSARARPCSFTKPRLDEGAHSHPSPPSLFGTTFMLNDGVQLGDAAAVDAPRVDLRKEPARVQLPVEPDVSCNGEPEHHHHH